MSQVTSRELVKLSQNRRVVSEIPRKTLLESEYSRDWWDQPIPLKALESFIDVPEVRSFVSSDSESIVPMFGGFMREKKNGCKGRKPR